MKKFFVFCTALVAAVSLSAQEPVLEAVKPEVTAKLGKVEIAEQSSYTPSFKVDGKNGKVKNVILMIGDGMGCGAVFTAMYTNNGHLTMTNLQKTGFVRTQSGDSFITDSAASGTAWACGQKTYNGAIGMDMNKKPIANIPEKVSPRGVICGVITTDDINGATPASFFAHQQNRKMTPEIWGDIPSCCLSFISGGSRSQMKSQPAETVKAIEEKYTVVNTADDPAIANSSRLIYAPESVKYGDRGNYLPETTEMAINYLNSRSKKGFFLMVEGARIDKEAHGNNYEPEVREALDFDKAIEAAIRFAEKDGHTLVIISADHETGGLTLKDATPAEGKSRGIYVSGGHTGMMVPLFAYGPKSNLFTGCHENSDVSNMIAEILGGTK